MTSARFCAFAVFRFSFRRHVSGLAHESVGGENASVPPAFYASSAAAASNARSNAREAPYQTVTLRESNFRRFYCEMRRERGAKKGALTLDRALAALIISRDMFYRGPVTAAAESLLCGFYLPPIHPRQQINSAGVHPIGVVARAIGPCFPHALPCGALTAPSLRRALGGHSRYP